jgi:hypothetical protein
MLSVANKPIMLNVVMLNVVMPNVVMLSVVAPFENGYLFHGSTKAHQQ